MIFNIIGFVSSQDVHSISNSLVKIANNGIPIIDTFAPKATGVNIVTTILATSFGGWLTLQLFKKQEKMRIREELRISFYKEYNQMYSELYLSLSSLNTKIKRKNKVVNEDLLYIKEGFIETLGLKTWDSYYSQEMNIDFINDFKNIYIQSNNINNFLKRNTYVFNLNTIYDEIHSKIDEIQEIYTKLESTYNLTIKQEAKLINDLDNPDELVKILNMRNSSFKFNKENAKDIVILKEKILEGAKEKSVQEHNKLVPRILKIDIELDSILDSIIDMNKIIEYEYISKYFNKRCTYKSIYKK